jgi:thiol-disulfide isomerase/thioredoxin
MNARLIPLSLICLLLWSMPVQALPRAGERMPDLAVNGTLSAEAAEYLGLPAGTVGFRLSEVRAEFLLVEIFSMYCPHCQHEAPRLNELFRRLPDSPLAGRLKVLGVGVGNSDFEVDFFARSSRSPSRCIPTRIPRPTRPWAGWAPRPSCSCGPGRSTPGACPCFSPGGDLRVPGGVSGPARARGQGQVRFPMRRKASLLTAAVPPCC